MNETKSAAEQYFEDMHKYPLLSKEETAELVEKMKNGDTKAREQLINCNLRLVVKFANEYMVLTGVDYLDLIQQGNIGLIDAVDNYDPKRGALSTCIGLHVKKSINRYLYDQTKLIRKPQWQQELSKQIRAMSDGFEATMRRKPTAEEIAKALDVQTITVERILQDNQCAKTVSLETQIGEDEDDTLKDMIPDETPPDNSNKYKKAILVALDTLNDEDRELIEYLYGVNGKPKKTLVEMAKKRNMTKQNIALEKARILNKLRYPDTLKEIRKQL